MAAGYKILTRSAVAGVDAFAKQDGSFFLYFQGHPEYDADSLFREYRRDVTRFLNGERESYPGLPENYFDDVATALAEAFEERAVADRRVELDGGVSQRGARDRSAKFVAPGGARRLRKVGRVPERA